MIQRYAIGTFCAVFLGISGHAFAVSNRSCATFQNAGPPVRLIVEDEGPRTSPPASFDPAVSVSFIYPRDYQTWAVPPLDAPRRQSGENFVMRMDGGPLPWSMRHTLAGRPIRPQNLPPHFRFLLHDRYSVSKLVPIRVRTATGLPWAFDMVPLTFASTAIEGLHEITNAKKPTYWNKSLLVSTRSEPFSDLIECHVPQEGMFPQCEHQFDYRAVDITASYSLSLLEKWREIKGLMEAFLDCTYAGESPHKPGMDPIWD